MNTVHSIKSLDPNRLWQVYEQYPEEAAARHPIAMSPNGLWWFIINPQYIPEMAVVRHEEWLVPYLTVPQGGVFVDVGANCGLHAIPVAKKFGAQVIAVEPHPDIARLLAMNALLNDVPVDIHQYAATDMNGPVRLRCGFIAPKTGEPTPQITPQIKADGDMLVDGYALDSSLQHLHRLDLIKIDTEGWECHILRGAEQIIARHRPRIICEIHARLLDFAEFRNNGTVVNDWVQAHGYTMRHISPNHDGIIYVEITT